MQRTFLLILGALAALQVGAAPRQEGITPGYTAINGRMYYIAYFEDPAPASSAIEFCNSLDMNLVSFESSEEYDAVDYYLFTHYMYFMDFWSGGRRVEDAWQWQWGEPFTFTAWLTGQPDEMWTDQELCVSFMSHLLGWSDRLCSEPLQFICEQRT